jgi:thioredoxin 1
MSEIIRQLTESNFESEVINSDKPVLVDFWAPWCGPCQDVAPEIDKLAEEKQNKLKVGKLNVDDNRRLVIKYGIQSIPTLILFKNGEVIKIIKYARTKEEILEEISEYL